MLKDVPIPEYSCGLHSLSVRSAEFQNANSRRVKKVAPQWYSRRPQPG